MDISKSSGRKLYEELRLLTKDTLEAIIRLKRICTDHSTHYLFINDHIGDMVISLGYLKAFREKNGINHLTLVSTEKYRDLVSEYVCDYENIIYIPPYDLYRIFLLGLTRFGETYLKEKYSNVTFINPADSALLGFDYFKRYSDVNLEKMIKFGCLGLDENAVFNPMKVPMSYTNKLKQPREALISKDSRIVEINQNDLYVKVVQQLLSLGMEVYTNTKYMDDCIEGTKPFYGGITEIRKFLQDNILIGVRNGLHDLAMYQNCKVVALYPKNNRYGQLFKLEMLPETRANYMEINLSESIDDDCKTIIDFIRG